MSEKEKWLLLEFTLWFLDWLDIEAPSKQAVKDKILEFERIRK